MSAIYFDDNSEEGENKQENVNSSQVLPTFGDDDVELAVIAEIEEIRPIKDADRIELVKLKGMFWQCVVQKGLHKTGDLVVYIFIDSIVPNVSELQFLADTNYRVKTKKLRGAISQGVILSLSDATNIMKRFGTDQDLVVENLSIGQDLTKFIGVKKYKKEQQSISADAKGNFPKFFPKTDQDNVKSKKALVEKFFGCEFIITEKLDGQPVSFYNIEDSFGGNKFGACSRNLEVKISDGSKFDIINKKYDIENKIKGLSVAIQGELVGPKINGNNLKLQDFDYYVYDIFDISNQKHFSPYEVIEFCDKNNIKKVPFICSKTIGEICKDSDFYDFGAGKSTLNKNVRREGVVFSIKNTNEHGRVTFKLLNDEYLLKDEV